LLDNLKAHKFSWGDLEALLTANVVSGKALYQGEGRVPNYLTWLITANNLTLSKDMAARCVIIRLRKAEYSASWEEDTRQLIQTKRWEIIGDIVAELKRTVRPLTKLTRWATWEQQVLSRVELPGECQVIIEKRQEVADGDQVNVTRSTSVIASTFAGAAGRLLSGAAL
jgi:hypothetical protein